MKLTRLICIMLGSAAAAWGQTTQPASSKALAATAVLELRATQAMSAGEYAKALPLLEKVEVDLKGQPDRLGIIEEDIRVCHKNLSAAPATLYSTATVVAGTDAQALVDPRAGTGDGAGGDARKPHPAPQAGQVVELEIKELGNFDYDERQGGNIPSDVLRLDGAKFRTRGYMMPLDEAANITEFALVPSLFSCCFGRPPQIHHTIVVHCPPGKAINYFPDEIVVQGTLRVRETRDDGYIVSVFEINADSIKPAPR